MAIGGELSIAFPVEQGRLGDTEKLGGLLDSHFIRKRVCFLHHLFCHRYPPRVSADSTDLSIPTGFREGLPNVEVDGLLGQEESMPTIAIIGTLDTKGEEFRFLKEEVERRGARALVIHAGIVGEPLFAPDVSADEVARAGGESLEALRARGDRGHAVSVMSEGVAALAPQWH